MTTPWFSNYNNLQFVNKEQIKMWYNIEKECSDVKNYHILYGRNGLGFSVNVI